MKTMEQVDKERAEAETLERDIWQFTNEQLQIVRKRLRRKHLLAVIDAEVERRELLETEA